MTKEKMSVLDFKKYKAEGRKFTYISGYDYTMASIIDESETEVVLVGDSLGTVMLGMDSTNGVTVDQIIHHAKPVVKGAPNTFVAADMPYGSYNVSPEQAMANANRIVKETNVDALKLEGGLEIVPAVERLVQGGITVMGHIGMTPQTATSLGGMQVQGATKESAERLIEEAQALEAAGVCSIVVAMVPAEVGKAMSDAVSVPIMGYGSGPYTDAQVLVTQDLLGMTAGEKPKYLKHFVNVREEMVKGLNAFHEESLSGEYPAAEHTFSVDVELPTLTEV